MDEKMKKEFIQMLKDARGTDNEWAVIMAMVDLLEDDDEFERLAELHKGKSEYRQFLTEHEAKKAVEGFINYDGSRGAKWPMPAMVWETIERLGGRKAEEGKYNCWAMFAVLNMIHSDYGGAIMTAVQGDAYVKMCYMLAVAWLCDRDERNDVRRHFGLE
jgi:hypothetical protein